MSAREAVELTASFASKTQGGTNLLVDPLPRDGGDASSTSGPASTGTLSFGHLALPSSSTLTPARKAPLKTLSNPTQALAHLQARKERLAELPSDKREAVEARERWATALERAEGGKVRDDEGRLKKAAKRVEKQKAKSGKEWCVARRVSLRVCDGEADPSDLAASSSTGKTGKRLPLPRRPSSSRSAPRILPRGPRRARIKSSGSNPRATRTRRRVGRVVATRARTRAGLASRVGGRARSRVRVGEEGERAVARSSQWMCDRGAGHGW